MAAKGANERRRGLEAHNFIQAYLPSPMRQLYLESISATIVSIVDTVELSDLAAETARKRLAISSLFMLLADVDAVGAESENQTPH